MSKGIEVLAQMNMSFLDLIDTETPIDQRTGEEIKNDIKNGLNALGGN